MTKLLLCDRDGVVNHDSDAYVKSADEWRPIEGSIEALARLHHAGWRIAIVTNQSGLARGLFDLDALNAMHAKMHAAVAAAGGRIDAIFFCPHGPDEGCDCRKPRPGMFRDALARFGAQPAQAVAVGDSLRDLEGAAACGVPTFLVRTGNGAKTLAKGNLPAGTRVVDDLAALAALLLDEGTGHASGADPATAAAFATAGAQDAAARAAAQRAEHADLAERNLLNRSAT